MYIAEFKPELKVEVQDLINRNKFRIFAEA